MSSGSVLLERHFEPATVAQLTENALQICTKTTTTTTETPKTTIRINEIFACEIVRRQQRCRTGEVVELLIHALVLKLQTSSSAHRHENSLYREKIRVALKFDTMDEAQEWERQILRLSRSAADKKFLVFINPNSGAGKAETIFHESVEPMFRLAGIEYDVKVTERPQYAHDYVQHENSLSHAYTGIIVCGGDGLMYEVMNGLAQRSDWHEIMQTLTFGIIPCGSGNGLVASMNKNIVGDALVSAGMAIVRSTVSKMDMVKVTTENQVIHSFLSITWGYMASVDIRSEAIKSLAGNARFTIWGIKEWAFRKTYNAVVSYLPIDCNTTVSIPELKTPLPTNDWITIEDKFLAITAAYQTHLSSDLHIAPEARLNDGKIWLLIVRARTSRRKFLLDFLLKLETGTHIPDAKDPDIQVIECKAVRIVPKCEAGCIAVDGEEIPFGPLQAEILPSIANVFVPDCDMIVTDTSDKNI